jgi:hypothetical protein
MPNNTDMRGVRYFGTLRSASDGGFVANHDDDSIEFSLRPGGWRPTCCSPHVWIGYTVLLSVLRGCPASASAA